jgi:cellulose synthase/poly-beta-1,6-N-acetylglucosamine synthase-like glycosyltransferase
MSSMRHDSSHQRGPTLGSVTRLNLVGADARGRRPTLSIIVPAKNEADSLPQLVREILDAFRPKVQGAMDSAPLCEFEIVIVNDGSTDSTPDVLRELMIESSELRPITLAKNVGQPDLIMWRFSTPIFRTIRPIWPIFGMLCRVMTRL